MKKKQIVIRTEEGLKKKISADCTDDGIFAIHPSLSNAKLWTITHRSSEAGLGTEYRSRDDAIHIMEMFMGVLGEDARKEEFDQGMVEKTLAVYSQYKQQTEVVMEEKKLTIKEKLDAAKQAAMNKAQQNEYPTVSRSEPEDVAPIIQKIQAIGDRKEINPPKYQTLPNSEHSITIPLSAKALEDIQRGHIDVKIVDETGPQVTQCDGDRFQALRDAKKEKTPTVCPTCGKSFKVLAKHKCEVKEVEKPYDGCATFAPDNVAHLQTSNVVQLEGIARPVGKFREDLKKSYNEAKGNEYMEHLRQAMTAPQDALQGMSEQDVADSITEFNDDEDPQKEGVFPANTVWTPENGAQKVEIPPKEEKQGYALFIDCLFEKGSAKEKFHSFSTFILPLCDEIANEQGCANWNTAPYGTGPGLLSRRLQENLDRELPPGVVLVSSATAEYRACAEVLKKYATIVVQGVR